MKMRWRDKNARFTPQRICFDALCICAALLLSYVETLLPISLIIPFPGIKLGLANLSVMLVFFCVSRIDAACVSFIRVLLSSLLFGSLVSFIFSLFGACFSYCMLIVLERILKKCKISFVGVSVAAAVLHGAGQIAAAMLIYTPAAFAYLPFTMITGVFSGTLVGILANLMINRIGGELKWSKE